MKKLVIVAVLLGIPLSAKQNTNLSQVDEIHLGFYTLNVVEDGSTGARCYVVTGSVPARQGSSSAISCLPKPH